MYDFAKLTNCQIIAELLRDSIQQRYTCSFGKITILIEFVNWCWNECLNCLLAIYFRTIKLSYQFSLYIVPFCVPHDEHAYEFLYREGLSSDTIDMLRSPSLLDQLCTVRKSTYPRSWLPMVTGPLEWSVRASLTLQLMAATPRTWWVINS